MNELGGAFCGLNIGVPVQTPLPMLLNARTVQPLFALMNESRMPLVPSLQTADRKLPQLMAIVPAGHDAVLTVVVHVPLPAGVQPSVLENVVMTLPGPAGP